MHADGDKLFCTSCNVVLNHDRRSVIVDHFASKKHKLKEEAAQEDGGNKRQKTIPSTLKNKTQAEKERVEICKAWVKTLADANIPLSKSEHPLVREFLDSRVRNGGAIPGRTQLTETYLPEVYLEEKENLKLMFKDKKIAVIFDECCDDEARSVLNVLFAPVDTVFLDAVNHSTVSQAVVKAANEYQIDYESILVIDTDNASYMKKAFDSVFSTLFPNSIHITCLAHIVNLIGESFRKPFQLVDTFVRCFKNMFYNSGSRKAKYLRFMNQKLQEESPDAKASMPPSPVGTRWNSWFHAVQYHSKNFQFYKEFFNEECKSSSPVSVQTIQKMLNDPTKYALLKVQIAFLAKKCEQILSLNLAFESRKPCTVKAFDLLEELQIYFISHLELPSGNLFKEAFHEASEKLDKYLSFGQPGLNFLKACRLFDPHRVYILPENCEYFQAIPGFSEVPEHELKLYREKIVPEAIQSQAVFVDLQKRIPNIAKLALNCVNAVSNSADAERSFSLYNLILSARRKSLNEKNLKALCFLYYNSNE
uniref:DUF659 domain-containing protein n=1 Tax=Latimeria chalumnae TaxID=7897 RepID=H3AKS8_LATCH